MPGVGSQVYLNGKVVPAGQAALSVFDAGLLHGVSVFTTMLAHNGKVFRLDRHLKRLLGHAQSIGLRHGATADELTRAVEQVLSANGLSEARVRITLTPGAAPEADKPPAPTTIVTAAPFDNPSWWYEKGLGVMLSRFRQFAGDPGVGAKTGCYLGRVLARQEAASAGLDEALWFTPDGRLAEACFCNVFVVREGKVSTPPLDTPVLGGIVREAVIELCLQLQVPCRDDSPLTIKDCLAAEEIFLTSSVAGIRPVVRIERHAVGEERPGPVTIRLMQAYRELLDR